ncbi:MAG: hypothetical protein KAH04_04395 [Psychrilyobacter sp.]|nr:hypothetical protein [Psychrilyobacter sp.]
MKYYNFGDIVEKGSYECVLCGLVLELESGEEIDLCPVCSGAKYVNLEK